MFLIKFFIYLFKITIVPIILILVWIFNFRPTNLIEFIDQNSNLSPATMGAIDVALLTAIYNLIKDGLKRVFKHPAKVQIDYSTNISQLNTTYLKYNPEDIENQEITTVQATIKGKIYNSLSYYIFKYLFRGIALKFYWHSEWLSVTLESQGDKKNKIKFIKGPGYSYFDLLPYFSPSDDEINIKLKMHINVNHHIKDRGNIKSKIIINTESKILQFLFNWIISLIIDYDIKSLSIYINKEEL